MAGRALPSFLALFLLTATSSAALADGDDGSAGDPAPAAEQPAEKPALPKLLGSGKGADGTHAFLFGRQGAPPVIYMGQPGQLRELEVLGIERYPGKFVVDTFERGEIHFNTPNRGSKAWSVTIPGDLGFNAKNPTVVMSDAPDEAVFLEAMQRMGFVRRTPLSSQTLPSSAPGRLAEKPSVSTSLAAGDRMGVVTMMKKGAAHMKARAFRRPTARAKTTRARPVARARAAVRH
ncbi:MAG TPA: hypothetical protein VFU21_16960 [Kofleriaceae bacterium]|nr:hypothetical protein [Kofleriaceae bacterium]